MQDQNVCPYVFSTAQVPFLSFLKSSTENRKRGIWIFFLFKPVSFFSPLPILCAKTGSLQNSFLNLYTPWKAKAKALCVRRAYLCVANSSEDKIKKKKEITSCLTITSLLFLKGLISIKH